MYIQLYTYKLIQGSNWETERGNCNLLKEAQVEKLISEF